MESFGGVRSSTKNKRSPVGSNVQADARPEGDMPIEFTRSGVSAKSDGSLPLLDLAEENDVDIGYACRSGSCGECKAKLLEGEVEMESEDGLESADKEQGYVLTCVALPKGRCVIDA